MKLTVDEWNTLVRAVKSGNLDDVIPSPIDGWVITYPLTGNRTATRGEMVAFVFGAA